MQTEKSTHWQRWWLVLPMIMAFGLGLFLYKGLGKDPNMLESNLLGKPLPIFSGETLEKPIRSVSTKDLYDEVALINVWATWCPTCRAEHTFLNKIATQEKVKIFGVNYHDQRDAALEWLQDLGNPYEFSFFDPRGHIGIELGVIGAPETYLIAADGTIVAKVTGELNERTWAKLRPKYQNLLAQSGN